MNHKQERRSFFLSLRKEIPLSHRFLAAQAVSDKIGKNFQGRILSFFSMRSEIDLTLLNRQLAKQKRLFLPRVEENELAPYEVTDLTQIALSPLKIFEPDPSSCRKASLRELDAILVPGLAFDRTHHRLGYGKGFYDRLLSKAGSIETIGLGFEEQQSHDLLPRDPWDISLKLLFLF